MANPFPGGPLPAIRNADTNQISTLLKGLVDYVNSGGISDYTGGTGPAGPPGGPVGPTGPANTVTGPTGPASNPNAGPEIGRAHV